MRLVHGAAIVLWLAAALAGQALWWSLAPPGTERERRRLLKLSFAQHALFAVVLTSGGVLLAGAPSAVQHARSLHLKVGLTLFLLVPLEAFHAYVNHVWIARALRDGAARSLERGIGLDD